MKKIKVTKKNLKETARVAISLLRGKKHVADFDDDELSTQLQNTTVFEFLNNKISVQFEMEADKVPKVWNEEQQKEINNINATLATHTTQISLILTTVQEMQKQIQQVQKQQQEMQKQIVTLTSKVDNMSDKLDNLADKFDQHLKNHN